MPNLEEAIRERAYHLWIAGGQPEGQAEIYWLNAQREIITTSVESSGSNAAAAAPTDTGLVATKSAKKGKGRPIRKNQNPRRIVPCEHRHAGPVTTTPSPAEGAAPLPLCSSKRVEADFQAWRDQRDGERMPPDWKPPQSTATSAGRHNPTA